MIVNASSQMRSGYIIPCQIVLHRKHNSFIMCFILHMMELRMISVIYINYLFFVGDNATKVCTTHRFCLGFSFHYSSNEIEKKCNCLPDCASITYDIETSFDSIEDQQKSEYAIINEIIFSHIFLKAIPVLSYFYLFYYLSFNLQLCKKRSYDIVPQI